jgi:multidrug resistance efflux pump
VRLKDGGWGAVARWPDSGGFPSPLVALGTFFETLARRALEDGAAFADGGAARTPGLVLIALATGEANEGCLLAVSLPADRTDELPTAATLLRLAADTPLLYQKQRQLEKTKRDIRHFAAALEILTALNVHTRFLPVAMALVNEAATRYGASRVALGWLAAPYIRVQAVSGTDRFEKKMEAVQRLEAAMEEVRDQDEEIVFPPDAESQTVTRDHAAYAKGEGAASLASVPLRVDGEVRGVLTLEREAAFTEDDLSGLRVLGDQVARRLDELRRHDRWFGARWARAARDWFAQFFGPRHTWAKVAAVAIAIALIICTLVPFSYRVEAPFIVRSDALSHLPAPFDGYLGEVLVRPGDLVKRDQVLLRLDTSDLLIEEAAARAELQRYTSEGEKAEADRRLADMRVSLALKAQAQARLDLTRYRLARAEIRAPADGVVVEGDLRERIGAPVKTGDVLMKVTQLDTLYVEVKVNERDIDQIMKSKTGQVAFTSRPEDTFDISVVRIEPSAVPERDGNRFLVRGTVGAKADWFRPGMSGIAKINAGDRSLLWIGTHRLVDFLRLKLWW